MNAQTTRILALMRTHPEGITALQALEVVGSFRLAARIHDLKAAGYDVTSETVKLPNGKRIARYRLNEQPTQLTLDVAS